MHNLGRNHSKNVLAIADKAFELNRDKIMQVPIDDLKAIYMLAFLHGYEMAHWLYFDGDTIGVIKEQAEAGEPFESAESSTEEEQ